MIQDNLTEISYPYMGSLQRNCEWFGEIEVWNPKSCFDLISLVFNSTNFAQKELKVMSNIHSLRDLLQQRKLSRRRFLKTCAALTGLLTNPSSMAAISKIALNQ